MGVLKLLETLFLPRGGEFTLEEEIARGNGAPGECGGLLALFETLFCRNAWDIGNIFLKKVNIVN